MNTVQSNSSLSTDDTAEKFIDRSSQYFQVVAVVNIVLKINLRLCYNSADMIYQDSSGILYGISADIFLNSSHNQVGKPTREHFLGFLISAFLR